MTIDELVVRLQSRAADPERRVDVPQTQFGAAVASMGVREMFGIAGSLGSDLARVVEANRSGQPLDPALIRRSEELHAAATTPLDVGDLRVADRSSLDLVAAEVGQPLPESLRRIYLEVADGGFGPGSGLLSSADMVSTYRELRSDPPAPRGLEWPVGMLPLVNVEPGYTCLSLPSNSVVDWDPELTSEYQDADGWAASFQELAPDVETWLGNWVESKTPAEERADMMAELRRQEMRRTRERIAAMSPEEREAVGLPAEGWEEAFIEDVE